jgi:hypothetical protein
MEDSLGGLDLDGRIIFKLILDKYGVKVKIEFFHLFFVTPFILPSPPSSYSFS